MKRDSWLRILDYVNPRQRTTAGLLAFGVSFFIVVLMLVVLPLDASATTFAVNSTADMPDFHPGDGICNAKPASKSVRPVCTLRAAIMEANALGGANTIMLKKGTYTITIPGQNEDGGAPGDFDINSDLTITGSGASTTIIDGGGLDRVFDIHSGNVKISGVTIRNGYLLGGLGGGIFNSGTLTLNNCNISGNFSSLGGGIFNSSALWLTNSTVSDNLAGYGGGIYNDVTAAIIVQNSTISHNTALGDGGGLCNSDGSTTLNNSVVSDNEAYRSGGGIGNSVDGDVRAIDCEISGNFARQNAGGIENDGSMELTACSVKDNSALNLAGGISNSGTLTLTSVAIDGNLSSNWGGGVSNSGTMVFAGGTVADNSAVFGGGILNGISFADFGIVHVGTATLTNVTVSGNVATDWGGGIVSGGPSWAPTALNILNCTISANSAPIQGGVFSDFGPATLRNTIVAKNAGENCSGTITSEGHNLEDADTCGFTGPGDIINTDPWLGPLADNGGPTLTHALLPGSPAIDAGDKTACPDTDQRGVARPQDGNGDGIAVCDIGAFEFTAGTFSISGMVMNGKNPFPGVTITLGGAASSTTTTDAQGRYNFTGLAGGSYTVTPSMTGSAFTPVSRTVTISKASFTGQNFSAAKAP